MHICMSKWTLGPAVTYREEDRQRDEELAMWDADEGSRLALYHDIWAWLLVILLEITVQKPLRLSKWPGFLRPALVSRKPCGATATL